MIFIVHYHWIKLVAFCLIAWKVYLITIHADTPKHFVDEENCFTGSYKIS